MSPRNLKLSPRVDGRLAAYAAVAGAALAAPAIPNADADIVWSGVVNFTVPSTTSGIYINFVTGVTSTTPAGAPGWDLNPWGSASFNVWANNSASVNDGVLQNFTGGTSATLVDNIPLGTVIDASWSYGRTSSIETTGATAFNLSSSNNVVGFRFLNEGTSTYNFGWARFSLAATSSGQPRLLVEYAYDNMGNSIMAGQVPEPSTFALLGVMAAGALGVRTWRKRKA